MKYEQQKLTARSYDQGERNSGDLKKEIKTQFKMGVLMGYEV